MNVLISLVSATYEDEFFGKVLDQFHIEECGIIYVDRETFKKSTYTKKYAKQQFFYEDILPLNYDKLSFFAECRPLDSAMLKSMEPYQSIILGMMERAYPKDYDTRWRVYCEHIRIWDYILDRFKYDIFITKAIAHEVYDFIIYALCKIKGINYIASSDARFPGYSYMVTDIYDVSLDAMLYSEHLEEVYRDIPYTDIVLRGDIDEKYKFYTDNRNNITPIYMDSCKKYSFKEWFLQFPYHSSVVRRSIALKRRFKYIVHTLLEIGSFSTKTYQRHSIQSYWGDAFKEYEILQRYYASRIEPADYTKKYIYIPLHMQPECTSSPCGGVFYDQLLMIKMISYYLPDDMYLYVKENPEQYLQSQVYPLVRNLDFYQQIANLKNVKLISMDEDTYKLLDNSLGVASLTGTAGFEALLKGKMFLMFGYDLLQYAPNVLLVRTNEECRHAVEMVIESQNNDLLSNIDYKKKLKIYFKSLEKYLFFGVPSAAYARTLFDEKKLALSLQGVIAAYTEKIREVCDKI